VECSKFCSFCIWHVLLIVFSLIRRFSYDKIWLLRCVWTLQLYGVNLLFSLACSIGWIIDGGCEVYKQIHHCMFHGWFSGALFGSRNKVLIQYYHGGRSTVFFDYHLGQLDWKAHLKEVQNVGLIATVQWCLVLVSCWRFFWVLFLLRAMDVCSKLWFPYWCATAACLSGGTVVP
jgi:hypothetical protein